MASSAYTVGSANLLPNATNINQTLTYTPLCGTYTWVGTNTTNTLTVAGLSSTSVVQATVAVDDQQGSGICRLISSAPTLNTITFTIAATASVNSTLKICWSIERF